jgi:hypothetical protein
MEYSAQEYGLMRVNVMALGMKFDPLEIEEFKKHKEYYAKTQVPIHKVIRYIVLCYDKNSPLVLNIPDINKRKVKACEISTINIRKASKDSEYAIKMINGDIPEVNAMIIRYVRGFYSELYSQYVAVQEAYYKELFRLQNGDVKNMTLLNGIEERLTSLKDKMFAQDHSKTLAKDFNKYIDEEELMLRPEDIAEMLAKDED